MISAMVSSTRLVEVGSNAERGLVHEEDVRVNGERTGYAESLLLATGQRAAWLAQPVLDPGPQSHSGQGTLDEIAARLRPPILVPVSFKPAVTFCAIDMVGNGFGFWNTIPIRFRVSVTRWPWRRRCPGR